MLAFLRDDEGQGLVEYALIIALGHRKLLNTTTGRRLKNAARSVFQGAPR